MVNAVGKTALLVAAIRAQETQRADALFVDPFAEKLAGEVGRQTLAGYRSAAPFPVPIIEVRTRFYDEALARAVAAGIRQIVILAAGMDARAYRIFWPEGTRIFELDQPEMLAEKSSILDAEKPTCGRLAIAANLAEDFSSQLAQHGFDKAQPTAWLVEGLLQYLDAASVERIFARIHGLSIAGSIALYDIVSQALLDAPALKPALAYFHELGAPWTFGTDDPASLVERFGWHCEVTDSAVLGNALRRWPFPATPPEIKGAPRGYLIEAKKR
jgi:methyltransferase (TIGR00027 family)